MRGLGPIWFVKRGSPKELGKTRGRLWNHLSTKVKEVLLKALAIGNVFFFLFVSTSTLIGF